MPHQLLPPPPTPPPCRLLEAGCSRPVRCGVHPEPICLDFSHGRRYLWVPRACIKWRRSKGQTRWPVFAKEMGLPLRRERDSRAPVGHASVCVDLLAARLDLGRPAPTYLEAGRHRATPKAPSLRFARDSQARVMPAGLRTNPMALPNADGSRPPRSSGCRVFSPGDLPRELWPPRAHSWPVASRPYLRGLRARRGRPCCVARGRPDLPTGLVPRGARGGGPFRGARLFRRPRR